MRAPDSSIASPLGTLAVITGVGCSILFVVVGLAYGLQMYGDGSIFSYAVAVQDAWAFHWHNISSRIFVYLFSFAPAELYVGLTGSARGGIAVYGLLFFGAQFLGLLITFAADRSPGRILFSYACFSTACLCPLVFGAPTEMWMAHALFWPALALCHYARRNIFGALLVFAPLLALIFTHEGALIFAAAILVTLLLRGPQDTAFIRAAVAFLIAFAIWIVVRETVRPDPYIAAVLDRAAFHVFDPCIVIGSLVLLLSATIAGYGILFLIFRRLDPAKASAYAAVVVAAALTVYWLWFDHALHAENRYYLRTILVLATPALGALAAFYAINAEGRLHFSIPLQSRLLAAYQCKTIARAILGAFVLVMLVHAVETAKFVTEWTRYKTAIRTLAMSDASDPVLGDPHFVSSARIPADLNRMAWFSTTPFLSVLLAPKFAPARLVIDARNPATNYYWLSCKTATLNRDSPRAIPTESRKLIRRYSCLHRP